MDRFPTDLLLYGAIFLMIWLFNFFARKRAAQQVPPVQDPGDEAALDPERYEQDEPPSEFWGAVDKTPAGVAIAPGPVARSVPTRARGTVPRRASRYDRRALFGSKHDVRKAIVLMTVLGPPRGAEPPDGGPAR
jgi:hypothetical protein